MRNPLQYRVATLCFYFLSISLFLHAQPPKTMPKDPDYPNEWTEIDSLQEEGLYRSALDKVSNLYVRAKQDKKDAQIIKSVLYKADLVRNLEEDGFEKAIGVIRQELEGASSPYRAIYQSLLAELYQKYLEEYAWKIENRTNLVVEAGLDIQTWTAATFEQESARLYLESVKDNALKGVALNQYGVILEPESNTENLWVTLYDLLVFRAITHFSDAQSYLNTPVYAFYLDQEAAFSEAETFASSSFGTDTQQEHTLRALRLFQEVLRGNPEKNRASWIDADLKRLAFVYGESVHPEKDSLYIEALEKLEKRFPNEGGIAEAMYARAQVYLNWGNKYHPAKGDAYRLFKQRAKALAEEAMRRFPKSYGAGLCAGLISAITIEKISVQIEEVVEPQKPILASVQFQNTKVAHFKLLDLTQDTYEKARALYGANQWKYLKSLPVLKTWSATLPDDGDFQQHRTEIRLDGLPLGLYALVVSNTVEMDTQTSDFPDAAWLAVSNLAYLQRTGVDGTVEFLVTHRVSGKPLEGVRATFEERRYRDTPQKGGRSIHTALTDKDGLVRLSEKGANFSVQFVLGNDTLNLGESYYSYGDYRDGRVQRQEETRFFLDRAIYRPGQVVYFKGICLSREGEERIPNILANRKVRVTFRDANYEEVGVFEGTTNTFGSFNGRFIAPSGGLLGEMQLESSIGSSAHTFRVEAYKRPRFEAALLPLQGEARLGEAVQIDGTAKNYAGNGVDGATVRFRVTRQARFPWWSWWRGYAPVSEVTEIALGETITDADGKFTCRFIAIPDKSVAIDQLPVFQYQLQVDVVDVTGETHSATRSVQIGYTTLNVVGEMAEEIDKTIPAWLQLRTENLDGAFVPVAGSLEIYRLEAPAQWFTKRYWDKPDRLVLTESAFKRDFPQFAYGTEDEPASWALGPREWERAFNTADSTRVLLPTAQMTPGYYLLKLQTTDAQGKQLELQKWFQIYDSSQKVGPKAEPVWGGWNTNVAAPGMTATFRLFNGQTETPVYVELKRGAETLRAKWIDFKGWREETWEVEEADRGDIAFVATFVRLNRAFTNVFTLEVPWTNKELQVEYQTFRDKLLPGAPEEWRLRLTGSKSDKVAAEMLAGMYDASLDQFVPHEWAFNLFSSRSYWQNRWSTPHFNEITGRFSHVASSVFQPMRKYPAFNWFGLLDGRYGSPMVLYSLMQKSEKEEVNLRTLKSAAPAPPEMMMDASETIVESPQPSKVEQATTDTPPLVRSNLKETVFFFPELKTDAEGAVVLSFKMNEALTRWKFMVLAHTKELQSVYSTRSVVTQKELMVFPNAPRFLREHDAFEFSAKVSNLKDTALEGTVKLELFDAVTGKSVDAEFGLSPQTQPILVDAGRSVPVFWKIQVPAGGTSAITYRLTATSGVFSDAEAQSIPILTNRMLVTESVPLFIRGKKTKTVVLEAMKASTQSNTLTPFRLALEFTSNPAWLAVKALPYLMEYPYECSEQVFSRYYANALAGAVVDSSPKIQAMFEQWNGTDALESQLQKNQELKAVLLEETPWVFAAESEEAQRRNIGILFDLNRMRYERTNALQKLQENQYDNGGFPWFAGGPESWHITQHIIAGLGKLQYLGVSAEVVGQEILQSGTAYLDGQLVEAYTRLLEQVAEGKTTLEEDHLSSLLAHYLYTRSFVRDLPLSEKVNTALAFYLNQAALYWNTRGIMEQGMLALALQRFEQPQIAQRILASLRERALQSEELGMYWKFDRGYFWNQRPIETQALLIEVFNEIGKNPEEVDLLKIWLLKNKQTNDWETTMATAEAVYALFRTGSTDSWLHNDKPVELDFPEVRRSKQVHAQVEAAQKQAEPGTGYFKVDWQKESIQMGMHTVKLENPNTSIAWGGLYWQYFEDLDKIKTFEETPLSLKKKVFVEVPGDRGPVLLELGPDVVLKPGDKLVVRLEIRVDREMEYIHLKDMRASGLEPINPLSGYKWQGGLGYYESPGDVATNFFIDYLPRGTFVFEYPLRVNHRGSFSNGITTLQSMYAPEFSSHSQGIRFQVH